MVVARLRKGGDLVSRSLSRSVAGALRLWRRRWPSLRLLLGAIAALALVPLVEMLSYRVLEQRFIAEAFSDLRTVAALKAEQIGGWLSEREGDATLIAMDQSLLAAAAALLDNDGNGRSKDLASRLEAIRLARGYSSVSLRRADGSVVLSTGTPGTPVADGAMDADGGQHRRVSHSELYLGASGEAYIDYRIAVEGLPRSGSIVLQVCASRFLFPLIQHWPTASKTAETLLVRREGSSILFLNELRHRKGTALRLRLPLDRPDVIAKAAFLGTERDIVEADDYRGKRALGAHTHIPGTRWAVIAKIDREEVLAPLHDIAAALSLVVLTALLLMAVLFLLLWRQKKLALVLADRARFANRDRLLALVFDQPFVGVAIGDADFHWLHVNRRLRTMLGYNSSEFITMNWSQLLHPDDLEGCQAVLGGLLRGESESSDLDVRFRGRAGQAVLAKISAKRMRDDAAGKDYIVAIVQDVTDETNARTALQASEQRFRSLVESINDWIWEVDADGRYVYASPQVKALLGYEPQEIIGKTPFDLMPPAEAARVEPLFRELSRRRAPLRGLLNVNAHRDGQWVHLETSGVPIIDAEGKLQGYRGIDRDVTWRIEIEEALRASERKYHALVEDAAEMVMVFDLSGDIAEINRAGETLLSRPREELNGAPLTALAPPGEAARIGAFIADLDYRGKAEYLDGSIVGHNGEAIPVDMHATTIEVAGRRVAQAIIHDISVKKQRERERQEQEASQRDALVREVHHRIKNSLQGVSGIVRNLAYRYPDLEGALEEIISQIRSVAVVHGLYGRASGARITLCNLVTDIGRNAESLWQTPFSIATDPACGLCVITEPEAVPLALVLNELLANAAKHRYPDSVPSIEVVCPPGAPSGCVVITNAGRLPEGFDFQQRHALGTGLNLIASLLPREGAALHWEQHGNLVTATLTIFAPVAVLAGAEESIPS